jgi:cyclohexa-1,5-dienecarbonyl-CoA hydratase
MPPTYSTISLDLLLKSANITLRNPPLNVITLAMMDELTHALVEIDHHQEVSAIVISGAGRVFSAGVDVAAHTAGKVESMLTKFHAVVRALINTKKVTVAAVHGSCFGGGAEVAMICDLAYTSETAQWGFPEIKLGCYPPVACAALASLIGQKLAADLILTGRTITGVQAAEIGLANRAVPENQLDKAVCESVEHLAKLSPSSLAVAKKAIYTWDSIHFDKGLSRAAKIYMDELMKTNDAEEGITAFLEKRELRWKGN